MKKKLITIVVVSGLVFSSIFGITGCSSTNESESAPSITTETPTTQTQKSPEELGNEFVQQLRDYEIVGGKSFFKDVYAEVQDGDLLIKLSIDYDAWQLLYQYQDTTETQKLWERAHSLTCECSEALVDFIERNTTEFIDAYVGVINPASPDKIILAAANGAIYYDALNE